MVHCTQWFIPKLYIAKLYNSTEYPLNMSSEYNKLSLYVILITYWSTLVPAV